MLTTMQGLINVQTTDANQVSTDNTTIAADQTKLTADQGQLSTDTTTQTNDAATFQGALALLPAPGAVASATPDGLSVVIYAAPGAVIPVGTPIPFASSVPIPAAPAPLVPAVPSSRDRRLKPIPVREHRPRASPPRGCFVLQRAVSSGTIVAGRIPRPTSRDQGG